MTIAILKIQIFVQSMFDSLDVKEEDQFFYILSNVANNIVFNFRAVHTEIKIFTKVCKTIVFLEVEFFQN